MPKPLSAQKALPSKQLPIALWRQLQLAADVIGKVRSGVSGSVAVEQVPAEMRAGVQALAFHAWRNMGRAEGLRRELAKRQPDPAADALLCLSLALVWDTENSPYDAFTLVNQAVEAAKRNHDTKSQANFLNACLRRFLREQKTLVEKTDADPSARWNFPKWWIEKLRLQQPGRWQEILQSSNAHAPMVLRVNKRKISVAEFGKILHEQGAEYELDRVSASEQALILGKPMPVHQLPGFDEGWVSVQDGAAQMAASLLLDGLESTKPRVLDACAAPGGKTAHLLELADADVIALEIDPARSQKIRATLERLGLAAQVLTADAARPETWWDGQRFDAILLDAPCSASGIVRRHPDIRWLRRPSDIENLANTQKQLLDALWPLLRPGGRFLYCTCSIFLEEGQTQLQTFLANNKDAEQLPSPGHLMPQSRVGRGSVPDNCPTEHDGFFYSLLQKRMA